MQITFEGTIHEILDQIEGFCKSVIKEHTPPVTCSVTSPATIVTFSPEDQAVAKVAVKKLKEVLPVTPDEIEPAPADLTAACMVRVNGSRAKKDQLIALLAKYEAKTVNGLNPTVRDQFWDDVKREIQEA